MLPPGLRMLPGAVINAFAGQVDFRRNDPTQGEEKLVPEACVAKERQMAAKPEEVREGEFRQAWSVAAVCLVAQLTAPHRLHPGAGPDRDAASKSSCILA